MRPVEVTANGTKIRKAIQPVQMYSFDTSPSVKAMAPSSMR